MSLRPVLLPLAFVVALAVMITALLWLFQRRLIYFPSPRPVPPAAQVLPGAEDVTLRTADGLVLGAWFLPAAREHSPDRRPPPAMLVANGNAGDRAARVPLAEALAHRGLSVLLFDYRGYGGNLGNPSEDGLLADARAAADHLAARDDVDADRLVYYGESLGTGVVAALSTERPPAALILRSPFPSLAEIGAHHYRLLPVRALLRDRYPVGEHLARLELPVLVLVGEHDQIVPPQLSRRLYDAAGEPKRWFSIPDAGHNDRALLDGERMIDEIVNFLGEHVEGSP